MVVWLAWSNLLRKAAGLDEAKYFNIGEKVEQYLGIDIEKRTISLVLKGLACQDEDLELKCKNFKLEIDLARWTSKLDPLVDDTK